MSKSIATIARHPVRASVVLALALAALLVGIMNVSAVHDISVFELEGDALDDVPAAVAGDDWDTVLLGGGGSADTSVFVDSSTEAPAVDSSAFHKGGSKDDNDVSLGGSTPHVWAFRESGPGPDKDDITNAYAASYAVGPDTIVYFGLDLFANNGNAFAGFWFFQEEIGLNTDGTFSGHHTDGDRLVLSDFTNGGSVSTIRVFEWKAGGGDVGANLLEITPPGVLDFNCDTIVGAHIACASVNAPGDADAPPWDYAPKGGSEGDDFPLGAFYEGGLNLGPDAPCFSSFLAETRASQSVTAKLWDFALGDFDTCGSLTIVKDAIPPDGTDFNYDGTGAGIDTDFDLDDADPDDSDGISDSITFSDLAPNGPRTVKENITAGWQLTDISCELEGGGVPNSTIIFTGSNPASTVGGTPGADTVEITSLTALEDIVCTFTNELLPDVTVDKDGTISYTITATNDGPGDATNVDIDDDLPGDLNWVENPNLAECSINGSNHLHCDIAILADGAMFSVTVEADIVDTSCTSDLLSNTADVAADNEDPNELGNNSATAVICAP